VDRPTASAHCKKDLEDFMLFVATGMQGKKGDDYYFNEPAMSEGEQGEHIEGWRHEADVKAVYGSVRGAWKTFLAWRRDIGHPVSEENMKHMTKVYQCSTSYQKFTR
jgi:hypothetical protein